MIGGALVGLEAALDLFFPRPLSDALLVLGWVVLTGGTHVDGLADALDGLGAWATPERRLEILHDPNSGPFAVVGVALIFIVKALALAALGVRWRWLLLTPVVARLGMLAALRAYPYARREGLGAGLRAQVTVGPLLLAIFPALVTAYLTLRLIGLVVMATGIVGALLFGAWAWARLRTGITGDVYGATVELTEFLILLVAVVVA